MKRSRLVVAPILAFALLFSVVESIVADACDGGSATVTMSAMDLDGGAGGSRDPDGHPMHLCHCTHVHGGIAPVTMARSPGVLRPVVIEAGRQSAPASVDRAPPLRPPLRVIA